MSINKSLFSEHYLARRLPEYIEWSEDAAAESLREQFKQLYNRTKDGVVRANEAQTEDDFIKPTLTLLGWHTIVQQGRRTAGVLDRPDYVLFVSEQARERANQIKGDASRQEEFWSLASALGDAKKWDRPLSERIDDPGDNSDPNFQMVRYIRTFAGVQWGILTNGRIWRLYTSSVSSAATQYHEVDLIASLDNAEAFKRFWLFFRANAYVPDRDGTVFPQRVLSGSVTYSRQVGNELKRLVFGEVFPYLAGGFVQHRHRLGQDVTSEAASSEIYAVTLSLLYKLLFLLYAEARDLLPVRSQGYASLSLSRAVTEIAAMVRQNQALGTVSARLYDNLLNLFDVIDTGDPGLSVPRYNGGLFKRTSSYNQFLRSNKVADDKLAQAVYRLAHLEDQRIDYAYLDVRELGAIYEGLLEFRLIVDNPAAGVVHLENDKGERRALGAYYTPNHIVRYIIEQTLSPILNEREQQYNAAMDALASGDENAGRIAVDALLNIKVCDPAMGSGHFLVEAVDFLTDNIIGIIERRKVAHPDELVDRNPVLTLLARIRQGITDDMSAQGLAADLRSLTDTQLLMRVVMKRCIYGVDLNPLAVELAKLSLWLHTFTIGAPLSFLDHHLRRGNSLLGVSAREVIKELGATLFGGPFANLLQATGIMAEVSRLADATMEDVEKSQTLYAEFETSMQPYKRLLDLWTSQHFGSAEARNFLVLYGVDALAVARGENQKIDRKYQAAFDQSRQLWERMRFFHWDLEFPEVFIDLEHQDWSETPGFDAVIGNPPYDELSEVALGRTIEEMNFLNNTLAYEAALGYRVNIYRLFIALALEMLKKEGWHGFIVPMSLVSDKFTYTLRKKLLLETSLSVIEMFPQKDDPHNRVFPEAKLSTCIYILFNQHPIPETTSFFRVHPGREILPDSHSYRATLAQIEAFDPKNLSIAGFNEAEWHIIGRLGLSPNHELLGAVADTWRGEIMINKSAEPYLSSTPNEHELIRGANIAPYSIIDAKQGESLYLLRDKYLADHTGSEASQAYKTSRLVYQRYAAIDNYRRLIGAIVPPDLFCSHTVGFLSLKKNLSVSYLLALWNSKFLDWRFNLTSSNNNINGYEVEVLPIPKINFDMSPADRTALVEEAQRLYVTGDMERLYHFAVGQWESSASVVVHDVLAVLADQMTELNQRKQFETRSFLEWLEVFTGVQVDEWTLKSIVRTYATAGWDEFRRALEGTKRRITAINVDQEIVTIKRRYDASIAIVQPLLDQMNITDNLINRIVYALYGLNEDEIALVETRIARPQAVSSDENDDSTDEDVQ